MMRLTDVLVLTPQITPTAARFVIIATWTPSESQLGALPQLSGRIQGPRCEYAETLADRIPLDAINDLKGQVRATARVLEPCFWAPEHPFCYDVVLELLHGSEVSDMRRIVAGIRHLAVAGYELLLNGQEVFIRGVRHKAESTIEELREWHEVECNAWLVSATGELCARTDRWGPMVLHVLPRAREEMRDDVVQMRNYPSLLMWVLPAGIERQFLDEMVETIKKHDPSRPIGQLVGVDEHISTSSPVDIFFLPSGHGAIGSTELRKPFVVLGEIAPDPDASQFDNFTNQTQELCEMLDAPPGLVGVIL